MLPMNWGPVYRLGQVILTPNTRANSLFGFGDR